MAGAALASRLKTSFQVVAQAVEKNASDDLTSNVQQGAATMVVATLAVSFPFEERHDCSALEILWDFSMRPHLPEDRRQTTNEVLATVILDPHRDRVRSGRFLTGELLHDPDGFVQRGREIDIDVGLHLRQAVDGGVGDIGGAVEDASEVLSPSLYYLCLLIEEGTAVGAEERCSTFGGWTVGGFDRGENVHPFVVIRVPLDFLGLESRPSVPHLAQPLLHKAATVVESSSVIIGGAVDVGFVQAVLLDAQVAGGGVDVIEPVLVLATCATEDGRGRRLHCVAQLAPAIFSLPGAGTYLVVFCEAVGESVSWRWQDGGRSTVGSRDCLCHQHIPLTSSPNEDVDQKVPLARRRVPPGGLISQRQAEEGVGQDKSVFGAGTVKEQAICFGAIETVLTQNSSPGFMVCADAGVKFTEYNQLICLRHSRQVGVQVLVGSAVCGVGAGHRRSVDVDDGDEFASRERQTEARQSIIDVLRQTRQSSHYDVSHGKFDARVPFLCPEATAAEESVAGTYLIQLALFGEWGLAECGDVHLVARQSPSH
ncbi:hypothetical protein SprV_0702334000 [Sparganum proliferum]